MIYIEESKNLYIFLNYLEKIYDLDDNLKGVIELEVSFGLFNLSEKRDIKHEFYNIYCSLLIDSNSYFKKLETNLIIKRKKIANFVQNPILENIDYIIKVLRILNNKHYPRFIKFIYLYNFKKIELKKLKNKFCKYV